MFLEKLSREKREKLGTLETRLFFISYIHRIFELFYYFSQRDDLILKGGFNPYRQLVPFIRVLLERREKMANTQRTGLKDHLENQERLELEVTVENSERRVLRVILVSKVNKDLKVRLVSLGRKEMLDLTEPREIKGSKEFRERREIRESRETRVPRVSKVCLTLLLQIFDWSSHISLHHDLITNIAESGIKNSQIPANA